MSSTVEKAPKQFRTLQPEIGPHLSEVLGSVENTLDLSLELEHAKETTISDVVDPVEGTATLKAECVDEAEPDAKTLLNQQLAALSHAVNQQRQHNQPVEETVETRRQLLRTGQREQQDAVIPEPQDEPIKKELAAVLIQSIYRRYRCRKELDCVHEENASPTSTAISSTKDTFKPQPPEYRGGSNEFKLQFLTFIADSSLASLPSSLMFSFQFYNFEQTVTERLLCEPSASIPF
eukprot:scaffold1788_cov396-Prasinococcus_capsulatus_cf.AAC.10